MMATPTYTLIDSTVLGSASASVTFSSIPATYRDLVLVVDAGHAGTGSKGARAQFNNDTGSNYSYVAMAGNGTSAASYADTFTYVDITYYRPDTSERVLITMQIMDYSATDKHKTLLSRSSNADGGVDAVAVRWASTSAMNEIDFFFDGANIAAGSTFYLYGIEA